MNPAIKLPEREIRFFADQLELRAASADEKPKVRGYAAKFGVESERLGDFVETIAPGAFDDVLQDDVRALFNHDPNLILARSKNGEGSLKISTDDTGLYYEFELPDTQLGRDLAESLKRGDIDQSSFSFTVKEQKWIEPDENAEPRIYRREITKVARLYDVSPVTYPAYPDATVALRSLEEFRKEQEPAPTPEPTPEQLTEAGDWAARIGLPE